MTNHTTSTTGGSEEHTAVTGAVLKIIDDERSRYKVALALTAYIAQATAEARQEHRDFINELDQNRYAPGFWGRRIDEEYNRLFAPPTATGGEEK